MTCNVLLCTAVVVLTTASHSFLCSLSHYFCFFLGMDVISGSSYWRLMGTMGGVTGPEMRINTFESLLSYYVLHRTRSKRIVEESHLVYFVMEK